MFRWTVHQNEFTTFENKNGIYPPPLLLERRQLGKYRSGGKGNLWVAEGLALKSSVPSYMKAHHGGLYLRRQSWLSLSTVSKAAIVITGTFPAAQLCTRSVLIFGSFFLSRARISRILWTLGWLANWSHRARLSCDCTFSSLGWKARHAVVCKKTVLINLGLIALPVFQSLPSLIKCKVTGS